MKSGLYREIGGTFYFEHGIGRALTLVVDASLKSAEVETEVRAAASDAREQSFGLPEIRLACRLPFIPGLARRAS